MVLIGVVAVALLAGSALGALVLAPRFTPSAAAKPAGHETKKKEGGHGKSEGGHGKKGESKKFVHRIENLIVNPAGSQGTRFLMTTIAIECPDEKTMDLLREHDIELRDIVIATLEGQTLEALSAPGARDRLKRGIETAIHPVARDAEWLRVYLPQFVIQ
jgi:flagellar FliL protein